MAGNHPGGSGQGSSKPPYTGPKVGAYDFGEVAYLCGYVASRCGQTTGPYEAANGCIVGIVPATAAQYGMTGRFPPAYPLENPRLVQAVDAWLAWRDGGQAPAPVPTPVPTPTPTPVPTPTPSPVPSPVTWSSLNESLDALAIAWLKARGKL